MKRITILEDNFFENINTESKAYFLGLIYSDGTIYKDKNWNSYVISLTQSEKDKDIIFKFKNALKTNKKIYNGHINETKTYVLSVNSEKMFNDLNEKGVTQNKSLTIQFPTFISDELMPHFIRGYFDGDGSVWEGKRKKMIIKKENKQGEFRERIVHNVKFNFTGSNTFIPFLQEYLINHLGLSRTKLNYSKAKEDHRHCLMEYSGRKNLKILYDYMYSSATIYGERKKEKFENILKNEKH